MRCARFPALAVVLAVSVSLLCGAALGAAPKVTKPGADDAKAAEAKSSDAKTADAKADDAKSKEARPDEAKPVEPKTKPGKGKRKPGKTKAGKQPSAATPAERKNDAGWQARHKAMNERIKKGNVDLIFLGDSITHGWEGKGGKEVWEKYYGKRNAVNLGIGGDRTQHVLWRLENGNIDGITPKLAVIMIGTNNSSQNSPEDIAAGIKAIVEKLRAKLPQTKVLVLGIFPRGVDDKDRQRLVNTKTNEIVSKLADDKNVYYLDIGPKFLDKDGKLTKEIMPDLLHLSAKGYTIWAESIEPTVAKLMGEKAAGK
jgi:lysophospholipase L1-like esterase